jgi:CRP-like cAMP-binding protein
MRRRSEAVARIAGTGADGPVEALRRRLAGSTAREHVVLDFLEDDLREAREALAAVAAWIGGAEAALSDADLPQERLLALALGGGVVDRVDALAGAVANVRRRIAQVAARM